MSLSNGERVITLGRRGRIRIRLDEGFPEVVLDVIDVQNQWALRDQEFRDENHQIPAERSEAWYNAMWDFVAGMLSLGERRDELSRGEALHFIKVLHDEAQALKPFFEPASAAAPSSHERTELIFSEED